MGISVVVPSWKGLRWLEGLFGSLGVVEFGDDDEIIVVLAGEDDGSRELVEAVREASPVRVRWFVVEENLGFSGNVNEGLRWKREENDVVILNNDVLINDPRVFETLQRVAYEHEEVGILSPLVVDPAGMIQAHGASVLPHSHDGRNWGRGERWTGQGAGLRRAQYVPFVCAFIKWAVLEELGPLDDGYFAYYEDVDFCLRAAEAGWESASTSECQIVHLGPGSTSRAELLLGVVYARSLERFEERWREKLWGEYEHSAVWVGELGHGTGFGRWVREGMLAGLDAGVMAYFQPARSAVHVQAPSPEPRTRDCQGHRGDAGMVQIVIDHADRFHRNSGAYRVGWGMCEVAPWPVGWLEGTRWVDEVWVPTEWERKMLIAQGVERPVYVMPLGVDPEYYHPGRAPWPQKPDADFVFVSVFMWCMRKNPDLLIRAFRDEFGRDEGVALFIKTMRANKQELLPHQTRWWMREPGATVLIYADPVPDSEMGRMYTLGDCFVLPTSGEGWCLPAMEALACGRPVITTGWGGAAEWGRQESGDPLPGMHFLDYELADPHREIKFFAGTEWAKPDHQHLRSLMREAYERRDEWKADAAVGGAIVRDDFAWSRVGERIRRRLEEIERIRRKG